MNASPSELAQAEDGLGPLDAALASLQPALAAAQLRRESAAAPLPRWFGPAVPLVSDECIEVLARDGTVLFISNSGAGSVDQANPGDPQPGFWLQCGNEDARRALDAANDGRSTRFQAVADTNGGDGSRWDVSVTPLRAAQGDIDAVLVVSRQTAARQREESLRQREEAIRRRETAIQQREEAFSRRETASRQGASAIEQVQAAAVQASAAELRLVADAMPAMIALIDRTLTYRFANSASVDWIGLTPDQLAGRTVRDVLGPDGFAWRQPYFEAALAGRETRIEADWPQHDGTPRVAEIRYLPRRNAQGGPDGFYAVVLDVTSRKRAE